MVHRLSREPLCEPNIFVLRNTIGTQAEVCRPLKYFKVYATDRSKAVFPQTFLICAQNLSVRISFLELLNCNAAGEFY